MLICAPYNVYRPVEAVHLMLIQKQHWILEGAEKYVPKWKDTSAAYTIKYIKSNVPVLLVPWILYLELIITQKQAGLKGLKKPVRWNMLADW